jgi:non-heme chloroperoxidase
VCLIGATLPFSQQAEDNPAGIPVELLEAVRRQWSEDFGSWIEENEPPYFGEGLPGCEVGRVLREWTRADLLNTSLRALLEFNRLGAATDFRGELADVRVPVRLIHGDHDASSPLEISARLSAALLDQGELVIYENAPHGLYLTHRARLNTELVELIS